MRDDGYFVYFGRVLESWKCRGRDLGWMGRKKNWVFGKFESYVEFR